MSMDHLPSSIATSLEEAGFSGTEILILRRLMDGEPLTIRQLGAKTGKSTGLLDQAMKKLLKKNIIKKTLINDVPKYSLDSLEAVVEWMQDDMEQKREMLLRRHQNFESFVTSLETGSKRPDIEYFEGESGLKQAYIKLLNGPGEILHYLPVQWKEEDDPLRDFRVQYFRERQHRKMFSRVLAHDTSLGRRYQSRDAFEYRKTVLIPENEYPFTFEKIITGDRIACFDHTAKTACVIRYPELADIEKTLFEAIWRQSQVSASMPKDEARKVMAEPGPEKIARSTVTMSNVREFFLSPKSIVAFAVCALLSLGITALLYRQNLRFNTLRIQERVKSIAATAALQLDAQDVEKIHNLQDIHKPEYSKIVHHLNRIRRENEGVKYIYIVRPTQLARIWEFVADADANPQNNLSINEDDSISLPGERYFETGKDSWSMEVPKAYDDIITDQWGTFINGTAPIRDTEGKSIAIIGVDVSIDTLDTIQQASFAPIAWFIVLFLFFFIIRLGAYNRALFLDIREKLLVRKTMLIFLNMALIASIATLLLYISSIRTHTEIVREKIATIAHSASAAFSSEMLKDLQSIDDVARPEYIETVRLLHEIRNDNSDITYAYLIRTDPTSTTFSFIADADAYGRNFHEHQDVNGDGIANESDEVGYPGLPYNISHIDVLRERLYNTPITSRTPYQDKWGFVFSGYAPIRDRSDVVTALIAIDMDAASVYVPTIKVFIPFAIFFATVLCYMFFVGGFHQSPAYVFARSVCSKKVIYTVTALLMAVYWIFFAFSHYKQNFVHEETGKRLMAIAATAASQFDPNDLDKIRFAKDMKTSEYQRVFKKLNEIREANPEILYIYIMRKTEDNGIWEFVVDADSNYFLPEFDNTNNDGVINEADESVFPGVKYDYSYWTELNRKGLFQPLYSMNIVDQWGSFVSATAPIPIKDRVSNYIIEVDIGR